ncbi:hypothetical protein [Gordonia sihwensis]|uniref:hypothetical protein n=1 Tax=Gordonia sihwensis TaxID=173559 RepID=UPI0005ED60F1|nr:hypothetical protein [Gordonia sihwensis]KJR10449.1 hypothetical protein UG54_00150 [Gordonia sihwensis]
MTTDWSPLARWHHGDNSAHDDAVELLNGIEPLDRSNAFELFMVALYAVTLDEQRLEAEYAYRSQLSDGFTSQALAQRQHHFSKQCHGDSYVYLPLSNRLAAEAEDVARATRPPRMNTQASDLHWAAAVGFSHLAQTIADELGMPAQLSALRAVRADDQGNDKCNPVDSYSEPWPNNFAERHARTGSDLYELITTPACIVCAVLSGTPKPRGLHPKSSGGDAGHPLIAIKSPLEISAPHLFTGEPGVGIWRKV